MCACIVSYQEMAVSLQLLLCLVTLAATSAIQESVSPSQSIAMELGTGSPTDPTDPTDPNNLIDSSNADERIISLVVGTVIAAGALITLCLFIVCGVLHCYFTSDKVADLDSPIEYTEVKEHEVWINFDVLDQLDPSIRANIDLNYLAQLTNTDPALLEKYKVQPSLSNKGKDSTYHSWASSLNIHSLFSPSRASLRGILPQSTGTARPAAIRRSATVRNQSLTNNDFGMKRVSTCADIGLLEGGTLHLSQTNLCRLKQTDMLPYHRSGSNPAVATADGQRKQSSREETLAMDLLRLLTVAKMANSHSDGQQESGEVTTTND